VWILKSTTLSSSPHQSNSKSVRLVSLRVHISLLISVIALSVFPEFAHAKNQKCRTISTDWVTIDTYLTTKKINHQISSPHGRKYELANGIWFGKKRVSAKKKSFSKGTVKSINISHKIR